MSRLEQVQKTISEDILRDSLVIEQPLQDYLIFKAEKNISTFNGKVIRSDAVIFSKDFTHWGIVEIKILVDWKLADVTKQLINYCELNNEFTYEQENFSKLKLAMINAVRETQSVDIEKFIALIKNNKPFLFLVSETTDFNISDYVLFKNILSHKFNSISFKKYYSPKDLNIYYIFDIHILNIITSKKQEIKLYKNNFLLPYPNILFSNSEMKLGLQMITFLDKQIPFIFNIKKLNTYHIIFLGSILGTYKFKDGIYYICLTHDGLKLEKKNA